MARQRSKCRTHNAWHKRPASASPGDRRRLQDRVWLCASPAGRLQETGWADPPHYALHKREAFSLRPEIGAPSCSQTVCRSLQIPLVTSSSHTKKNGQDLRGRLTHKKQTKIN